MFKHNKNFGQHFLNDSVVLDKILLHSDINNKSVVEIGPGNGVLTRELLKKANNVLSIEIDSRLKNVLEKIKIENKNFDYIIGDILKLDITSHNIINKLPKERILVANLPYNIGTQIILNFLYLKNFFSYMIVMLQKEVAERIVAQPNTKNYGRLSIIAQYLSQVSIEFEVNKTSFSPPPKVQSAVLSIVPYDQPLFNINIDILERVTQKAFFNKRKIIKNSLKDFNLDFTQLKISENLRAENLTLKQYADIVNFLS